MKRVFVNICQFELYVCVSVVIRIVKILVIRMYNIGSDGVVIIGFGGGSFFGVIGVRIGLIGFVFGIMMRVDGGYVYLDIGYVYDGYGYIYMGYVYDGYSYDGYGYLYGYVVYIMCVDGDLLVCFVFGQMFKVDGRSIFLEFGVD